MSEEAERWHECAESILWYFGYPRALLRGWTHAELQAALSFACGIALGSLVKAGVLRETLALLGEPAGDAVPGGGESVTGDGGDGAGGPGLRAEKVDDVGDDDESDGDPKL